MPSRRRSEPAGRAAVSLTSLFAKRCIGFTCFARKIVPRAAKGKVSLVTLGRSSKWSRGEPRCGPSAWLRTKPAGAAPRPASRTPRDDALRRTRWTESNRAPRCGDKLRKRNSSFRRKPESRTAGAEQAVLDPGFRRGDAECGDSVVACSIPPPCGEVRRRLSAASGWGERSTAKCSPSKTVTPPGARRRHGKT